MSDQYLGEVRIFSFNYAPKGWALCNGTLLPVQQYNALFALLGTTYGGNGVQTFGLPNLQGRMAYHQGNNQGQTMVMGQNAGEVNHTLMISEIPAHNHIALASTITADNGSPVGGYWAVQSANAYSATATALMNPGALGTAGNSQPHANQHPLLVLNFCIALSGIFPSRN